MCGMDHVANIIGLCGVAGILLAYALIAFEFWQVNQPRYALLNMASTACIIYSLFYAWNWPSFVLNVAWILISVYGLWRIYKERRTS